MENKNHLNENDKKFEKKIERNLKGKLPELAKALGNGDELLKVMPECQISIIPYEIMF